MRRLIPVLPVVFGLVSAVFGQESTLSPEELAVVRFDQNLDAEIPGGIRFFEERGEIAFSEMVDGRPAVLVLGYDGCPMLCGLTLEGIIASLKEVKLAAGKDFSLIHLSIDPDERIERAAARKRELISGYGARAEPEGWFFLTGNEESIGELAELVGFHFVYDPGLGEYAHPSGFVVVTPEGRVSRYFFGIGFEPSEVNSALLEAGRGKTGSPVRQFLLTCFQYNPLVGKYGPVIMKTIRVGGLLFLGAIGFVFGRSFLREREKKFSGGSGGEG